MVGPVLHGVTGCDVQMDEGVIHRLERGPVPAARGRVNGEREGSGGRSGSGEEVLHHDEEGADVADQVVGLALGDRVGQPGLGRGPLGGPGGEEGGPLPQLGGDLTEQHPGAPRPAAGRLGPGARGQHGRGRPQRTQVRGGVPLARIGVPGRLAERAVGLVEELGGRGGQRRGQGQLAGGHGSEGAHQSCTRTSHQRLPAASQDRS